MNQSINQSINNQYMIIYVIILYIYIYICTQFCSLYWYHDILLNLTFSWVAFLPHVNVFLWKKMAKMASQAAPVQQLHRLCQWSTCSGTFEVINSNWVCLKMWLVPHCTQWFCWSLSLWKMAISLGVWTPFSDIPNWLILGVPVLDRSG